MKKLITLILAGILAASFTGCGNSDKEENSPNSSSSSQQSEQDVASDPVSLLSGVWETYAEDDKFPVAGGDFSEENMNPEGAGRYSISDPDAIDNALGFPAASVDKLEDAASLLHMMNGNTFTAAAYQVKDKKEAENVASELKSNILARQWMCGMPDKLIVAVSGKYVVSCFGENEIVDTFKSKLTEKYPSVKIISEDAVTA